MRQPAKPIPQRIAPLAWRQPAFVWTLLALALALGGPAFVLQEDGDIAVLILIAGAVTFAVALVSLGVAWATKHAPRTRRVVVLHVLAPGALVALASPFVFGALERAIALAGGNAHAATPSFALAASTAPLGVFIGLPIVLFAALVFACVAFTKAKRA